MQAPIIDFHLDPHGLKCHVAQRLRVLITQLASWVDDVARPGIDTDWKRERMHRIAELQVQASRIEQLAGDSEIIDVRS